METFHSLYFLKIAGRQRRWHRGAPQRVVPFVGVQGLGRPGGDGCWDTGAASPSRFLKAAFGWKLGCARQFSRLCALTQTLPRSGGRWWLCSEAHTHPAETSLGGGTFSF